MMMFFEGGLAAHWRVWKIAPAVSVKKLADGMVQKRVYGVEDLYISRVADDSSDCDRTAIPANAGERQAEDQVDLAHSVVFMRT
jgi:hypothetical protein